MEEKKTRGITGNIYGCDIRFNKMNQTTIWKIMNKMYEKRKEDDIQKQRDTILEIKEMDDEIFENAFNKLKSKCRKEYISFLIEKEMA